MVMVMNMVVNMVMVMVFVRDMDILCRIQLRPGGRGLQCDRDEQRRYNQIQVSGVLYVREVLSYSCIILNTYCYSSR